MPGVPSGSGRAGNDFCNLLTRFDYENKNDHRFIRRAFPRAGLRRPAADAEADRIGRFAEDRNPACRMFRKRAGFRPLRRDGRCRGLVRRSGGFRGGRHCDDRLLCLRRFAVGVAAGIPESRREGRIRIGERCRIPGPSREVRPCTGHARHAQGVRRGDGPRACPAFPRRRLVPGGLFAARRVACTDRATLARRRAGRLPLAGRMPSGDRTIAGADDIRTAETQRAALETALSETMEALGASAPEASAQR